MKRPLTVSIPHHFHYGPLLVESCNKDIIIPHCMVTIIGKVCIDHGYSHCYRDCNGSFQTCKVCVQTRWRLQNHRIPTDIFFQNE